MSLLQQEPSFSVAQYPGGYGGYRAEFPLTFLSFLLLGSVLDPARGLRYESGHQ